MTARHVLVVEDDEATRSLLIQALRDEGFDPIGAPNGRAALDVLGDEERAGRTPALIVLDLYMPVMDGPTFASEYRARFDGDGQSHHPAPIVLLTAGRPSAEQLAQVGAAAFVGKPFDLEALFGSVRDVVGDTSLRILMIEDNQADARLVAEILSELPGIELEVAGDGADGLRTLERHVASASPHHLVLLDLGLPRLDGFTVLETVKGSEQMRRLPVVVMTGSTDGEDVVRAYDARANGYVVKSGDLETMRQRVRGTLRFWQMARLPRLSATSS